MIEESTDVGTAPEKRGTMSTEIIRNFYRVLCKIVGFPEVTTYHTNSVFYRVLGKLLASRRCQHMHIIPILFLPSTGKLLASLRCQHIMPFRIFYRVLGKYCWLPVGANISYQFVFLPSTRENCWLGAKSYYLPIARYNFTNITATYSLVSFDDHSF